VATIAFRDFEVVKKRWGCALLSKKHCCFKRKPAREVDELDRLKKEEQFGRFATVWLGAFAMLSRTIGSLVGHENTRR